MSKHVHSKERSVDTWENDTKNCVKFSKSLNFTLLTCFQVQGFVIVVGFVVIPYKLLFDSLKVALDLCCTNMIK